MVVRQTDKLHHTTDEYFTIVRCNVCGLHYTNPRPSPAEIARFYPSDYSFHGATPRWRELLSRLLDWCANGQVAWLIGLVPAVGRRLAARVRPRIPDPVLEYYRRGGQGAYLDIGCGSGRHAHYWGHASSVGSCQRFTQVAGVEASAAARELLAREGIDVWGDIDQVPLGRMFAVIRMNWSLEHVHSPSRYFRFIAERLLPGGRAVIAVPNYEGLIYRVAPDCVELPIHLYHFRACDIAAYADRFGLVVKAQHTFSYPEMFRAAGDAGLLPTAFADYGDIFWARAMMRSLKPFDDAGWGNDLLVVIERNGL